MLERKSGQRMPESMRKALSVREKAINIKKFIRSDPAGRNKCAVTAKRLQNLFKRTPIDSEISAALLAERLVVEGIKKRVRPYLDDMIYG